MGESTGYWNTKPEIRFFFSSAKRLASEDWGPWEEGTIEHITLERQESQPPCFVIFISGLSG